MKPNQRGEKWTEGHRRHFKAVGQPYKRRSVQLLKHCTICCPPLSATLGSVLCFSQTIQLQRKEKTQHLLVKETRRVKMEINSRGSSTTRSSEPTENASLIENQEPTDFDDSSIISQGAEAAATVADPPLVSVGDSPPTSGVPPLAPSGPPPVYCPQGELPPPYHVAATLPTYEEAELIKGDKIDKS